MDFSSLPVCPGFSNIIESSANSVNLSDPQLSHLENRKQSITYSLKYQPSTKFLQFTSTFKFSQ